MVCLVEIMVWLIEIMVSLVEIMVSLVEIMVWLVEIMVKKVRYSDNFLRLQSVFSPYERALSWRESKNNSNYHFAVLFAGGEVQKKRLLKYKLPPNNIWIF